MATWNILGIPVTIDFSAPPMWEEEADQLADEIEDIDSCIDLFEGYHQELIQQRRQDLFQRLDGAGMVDHSNDEAGTVEVDEEGDEEEEPEAVEEEIEEEKPWWHLW